MEEKTFHTNNNEYPLYPSEPQDMPEPTLWPMVVAFGVLFTFWGLITSLVITGVGILIMIISIAGWISDLNHE